jgi:predicted metal-binding protein
VKVAKGGRGAIVLVCGKCSKKVGGGFGKKGRTPLAKALREVDSFGKGRKSAVQVTETKCLGLCPKGAVTVVDPRDPLQWLVVEAGEDVADVAARLMP